MALINPLLLSILTSLTLAPLASAHASEAFSAAPDGQAHRTVCDLAQPPDVSEHAPPADCTVSKDTGYMGGAPFEITVVHIDNLPVEQSTANAYWVMREAAAAAGVDIHIVSGFRTMGEQQELYSCYINCSCNMCNPAAAPGHSNHQSGHALDLNTDGAGVYNWLATNGGAYGFTETVADEPWHWEWWGGGPGGGLCGDISAAPQGWLDAADCEKVHGWAQDPDAPDAAIDVHVYFNGPAGDPNAVGVAVTANQHREDLCVAIGSCAHGYSVGIPAALRDNAPHAVHVYGIDIEGINNPQLSASPSAITCGPPTLPPGVRRHISTPDVLTAWKFNLFWQLVHVDEPTLLAIPEWKAIDPAPLLLIADDGTPEVWLKDGPVRRHVLDPMVAKNWGFDLGTVVQTPAAEVYAIPLGTPVWNAPILVQGPGPAVYQLDDMQCWPDSTEPACQAEPGTTTSSGDTTPTSGPDEPTTGDADDSANTSAAPTTGSSATAGEADDAGGCACTTSAPPSPRLALGLLVLGLLARRRPHSRLKLQDRS